LDGALQRTSAVDVAGELRDLLLQLRDSSGKG
jgi:hypothetical protein